MGDAKPNNGKHKTQQAKGRTTKHQKASICTKKTSRAARYKRKRFSLYCVQMKRSKRLAPVSLQVRKHVWLRKRLYGEGMGKHPIRGET